ncbi:hypothetical protein FKP32DRAFT_418486 [Trametes sanguinea]|nr:hypothetical protein FKP32DRAFT_418486 [Trametes sanguinea]
MPCAVQAVKPSRAPNVALPGTWTVCLPCSLVLKANPESATLALFSLSPSPPPCTAVLALDNPPRSYLPSLTVRLFRTAEVLRLWRH